jgi:hypothetical protein
MYAAGNRALDQREVVTEGMEGLLAPGYEALRSGDRLGFFSCLPCNS